MGLILLTSDAMPAAQPTYQARDVMMPVFFKGERGSAGMIRVERIYPERFAQEALGHNSKAVHHAYAKKTKVRVPSLDEYERRQQPHNVVPLPAPLSSPLQGGESTSTAAAETANEPWTTVETPFGVG